MIADTFARLIQTGRNELAFVRRRWPRRAADVSLAVVGVYLVASAMITLAAGVLLDPAMDRTWRTWSPMLRSAAKLLSDFGYSGVYLVPALVAALWLAVIPWRRWPSRELLLKYNRLSFAWLVFSAVGLSTLASTVLKHAIGRGRPLYASEYGIAAFRPFEGGWTFASFPSGHATAFGAVCAIAALLLPKWRWPILLLVMALGSVRVIEGVHFPSDSVAGLLIGLGITLLVASVFRRLGLIFDPAISGIPRPKRTFRLTIQRP